MSDFAFRIKDFEKKTNEQIKLIMRKVAMEILARVVNRTPVDQGRARGNWQVEIGTPSGGVIDEFDAGGGTTISQGTAVVERWEGDQAIFLVNNLPYIMRLENGWSGQAPSGMVRITLEEYQGIVQSEAT